LTSAPGASTEQPPSIKLAIKVARYGATVTISSRSRSRSRSGQPGPMSHSE